MTPCTIFHHYYNGFVHTAYICQHGQRAFWDLMLTNLGLSEDLPIQGLNCTGTMLPIKCVPSSNMYG